MKSVLRLRGVSRVICLVLVVFCGAHFAQDDGENLAAPLALKLLPDRLGEFEARAPAAEITVTAPGELPPNAFDISVRASRDYFSNDGQRFIVSLAMTRSEPAAYSVLTYLTNKTNTSRAAKPASVGTAGVVIDGTVYFYQGVVFALVSITDGASLDQGLALARALASSLDKGESGVPVLVNHLPNWQSATPRYAITLETLAALIPSQPIINEISFEGGTEAVTASYGQSQLVIVEFTTPQFAGDNDRRIVAKIQELRSRGQAVPTAYRRVGNYSVFVFNAPDEITANQLIDKVKYQQVVQWLGDDPHLFERLQRYYAETSANVLVAVLETSGLSLIFCLGIGALIGTLLFRHRRAQKATRYSDAGGTVRLNLDELTGTRDSHRLLGSHSSSESNPDQN